MMSKNAEVIAPKSGDVYYSGQYWNDFPQVRREINSRATDNQKTEWYDHFFATYKKPFRKVLILNCGNGWVERLLASKGYVTEVVGVDYDEGLLDEARQEAGDLPFRYYKMDINTAKFPEAGFDLVINHASGHHIAKVNKVFNELLNIIKDDGLFVNFDYVGPHRNQYPIDQWQAVFELNQKLPSEYRQELTYPHLSTMLVTDPSEAIHSELVLSTMKRYFDFDFYRPIGGALAYPLLTHNTAIQKASAQELRKVIKTIMEADKVFMIENPDRVMFAYWVGRPNKKVLSSKQRLLTFQNEENARERAAERNGGVYYQPDLIQTLYNELSDLRIVKQHKQKTIEELQQELTPKTKKKKTVRQHGGAAKRKARSLARRIIHHR